MFIFILWRNNVHSGKFYSNLPCMNKINKCTGVLQLTIFFVLNRENDQFQVSISVWNHINYTYHPKSILVPFPVKI